MAHEFKIVLEGVTLSPEQEQQLRDEVQQVALRHLAQLDLGGDRGAVVLPLQGKGGARIGNGSTQGIWARVLPSANLETLLRE